MFRERIEQELKTNPQLRKYIRKLAKCTGRNYPIILVDSDESPIRRGRSGYRVPRVPFRNALAALAMSMSHHSGYWACSTKRIEVGSDWLIEELFERNYLKVNHG